jgi:O-antigen/teichoic acid export membrane protein
MRGLKKLTNFIQIIFVLFGIDKAIGYSVVTRVLQALGGMISLFFIALTLDINEQGYYYTFGSIIGIQIFFELGVNSIIVQLVAHETAHLKWGSDNKLIGKIQHISRLSSLLQLCLKYFTLIAFVLFVTLQIGGYFFFKTLSFQDFSVSWEYPWFLLVLSTSLLFIINPIVAFIEGLGKVNEVAILRFYQQIIYLPSLILVLLLGGKLWALGIASFLSFLFLFFAIIISKYRTILINIYNSINKWRVVYIEEIFPFQWRIALSWMSGYLIFQLFNPILFATEGSKVAGQMGMTLVAINGISSISFSWINTKVPLFSRLIAKNNFIELDYIFNKTVKQLLAINLILTLSFIFFISFSLHFKFSILERFLDISLIIVLGTASFFNQFVFAWAAYLRSHKKEPFLINSLVLGFLITISLFISAHYYGVVAIVLSYSAITLFIGFPWAYYIFQKKRREWHEQ